MLDTGTVQTGGTENGRGPGKLGAEEGLQHHMDTGQLDRYPPPRPKELALQGVAPVS